MSTSAMDPLLLLRTSLSSNATITLLAAAPPEDGSAPDVTAAVEVFTLAECTHFGFPAAPGSGATRPIFSKETKTRYLTQVEGEPYDLQSLLFAYLQREAAQGEYMRHAREEGIKFVSVIERKGIVEWLSGKSDIDGQAGRIVPLPSSAKRPADAEVARGAGDAAPEATAGASVAKKQRYVTNKEDLAKVKTLISLMDGPVYAIGTGSEAKADKAGGAYKNRETVLRGDRVNVRPSPC